MAPEAYVFFWDESLDVGYDEFNKEHKEIINALNAFDESVREKDMDNMFMLIGRFNTVFLNHLKHEEEILEKYKYPYLAEHKKEHKYLTDEISKRRAERPKLEKLLTNMIDLKKAIHNHILTHDLKYKEFLKDKIKQVE